VVKMLVPVGIFIFTFIPIFYVYIIKRMSMTKYKIKSAHNFINNNIGNDERVIFVYESGHLDRVVFIIFSIIIILASYCVVIAGDLFSSRIGIRITIGLVLISPVYIYALINYINTIFGICIITNMNIYFSNASTFFKVKKYDLKSIRDVKEVIMFLSDFICIYFHNRRTIRLYNVKNSENILNIKWS